MAALSSIWSILKMLPQIWALFKSLQVMVKEAEEMRKKLEKKKAIEKLQNAKTEQEVKDAAHDYLNKG